LTQDIDKVRKRWPQFDVDNWEERKAKMKCLIAFATASLKDDRLLKHRAAYCEKYSHDEPEVKRQSLSVAP